MRLAALSDIHGNRWALEAVLADIEGQRVDQVVNLGDVLFGPLDPGGTAEMVLAAGHRTVYGNQDDDFLEPTERLRATATWRHVDAEVSVEARQWLADLPGCLAIEYDVLLCHGTPDDYNAYLVEEVRPQGVVIRPGEEIAEELPPGYEVVLCGHSHVPRLVSMPNGTLVVNPGSVGLPAYTHNRPYPHVMEAGSPHARYAILEPTDDGWSVEHRAVPYDVLSAVAAAKRLGREDWALWLASGRA